MSGLVLKLAPNERILINGATIQNGERRGQFNILTPNANILRLRDAIHPEDANTPVRRLCYSLQLKLSGDAHPSKDNIQILNGITALKEAFCDRRSISALEAASMHLQEPNAYKALKCLRSLIPMEQKMLELHHQ